MESRTDWFTEQSPLWPGRALSLEIERMVYRTESAFQVIEVYDTRCCGRMLALDGVIQFTEADEFAYQEMMVHPALFAHPGPESVLVIGGGDGGVLREVARHPGVREIHLVELDEQVVAVCRAFVPSMAAGFDDPRSHLFFMDGVEYLASCSRAYDVVIVDSTDPVGPGEALFQPEVFAAVSEVLEPGGVVAMQAESVFLHPQWVQRILSGLGARFSLCAYGVILVPTYPGGSIGFCLASNRVDGRIPIRFPSEGLQARLKYYTPQTHRAAFSLPAFAERLVRESAGQAG